MRRFFFRLLTIASGALALAAVAGGAVMMLWERSGGDDPVFIDGVESPAALERNHPLALEDRRAMTAEILMAMTPAERDQVYVRIAAGPPPDGIYEAELLGTPAAALAGLGAPLPGATEEFVEQVADVVWSGRRFDAAAGTAQSVSRDFDPVQVLVNRVSAVEGVAPVYRNFPVAEVPRGGLLGLVFSTTSAYAVFPARLHCGVGLADPRRESHVIDHRRNDRAAGYRPIPDAVAGDRGLALREELRLVRPGLYLGHAHAAGVPIGHVILWRDDADPDAEIGDGPCWVGEPRLPTG